MELREGLHSAIEVGALRFLTKAGEEEGATVKRE